jgi:predicted small lipoprotein YifL
MRPLSVWLLSGAGVASLCACGCFGPMYNPNGAWGAPGYSQYNYPMGSYPSGGYPGSIQTLTPGQQYVPGSSIPGGSSLEPTPTYGGGSAAPYGAGGASPAVPTPSDPGNNPYFVDPNAPYRMPNSGASVAPSNDAPPYSGTATPSEDKRLSRAGQLPLGPALRPAAMTRQIDPADAEDYGHDVAGYAWVEGVVSYDAADQTWNIVYNLNPGAGDEYAGHFTLADSPLLRTLREGERLRLEGRVDPLAKDRFGKPTYLPERVIREAA